MTKISGFTFGHNLLDGGYPIVEAILAIYPYVDEVVFVDMQSNDGTRELLEKFPVRIIDGVWDCKAGETLANAHAQNIECEGEVIWHFEADEVFDILLAIKIWDKIKEKHHDISVQRLQVEQNFQRVRWYPHWVHRIFPKGSVTKNGETTFEKDRNSMDYLDGEFGYLWDVTNCFRDSWKKRIEQQSELRKGEPLNTLMVPEHCIQPTHLQLDTDNCYFDNPLWTAKTTPLNLPYNLQHLVGITDYKETINGYS
jgi:hypothetical protein